VLACDAPAICLRRHRLPRRDLGRLSRDNAAHRTTTEMRLYDLSVVPLVKALTTSWSVW